MGWRYLARCWPPPPPVACGSSRARTKDLAGAQREQGSSQRESDRGNQRDEAGPRGTGEEHQQGQHQRRISGRAVKHQRWPLAAAVAAGGGGGLPSPRPMAQPPPIQMKQPPPAPFSAPSPMRSFVKLSVLFSINHGPTQQHCLLPSCVFPSCLYMGRASPCVSTACVGRGTAFALHVSSCVGRGTAFALCSSVSPLPPWANTLCLCPCDPQVW